MRTLESRNTLGANAPGMILIDGERLAELMIDHNVGVMYRETYAVKRIDSDYSGEAE